MFILLFSLLAHADNITAPAKVEKIIGTVLYDKQALKESSLLSKNASLETKEKSFVRLYVDAWKSSIVIGPSTKMDLDLTTPKEKNPKRYLLKEGFCRWVSDMKSDQLKGSHIYTKSAAMGIRGTDFWIKNSPTGETEIIVFDGEVLLHSQLNQGEALIRKGQWGGVGGKFGKNISPIKNLSAEFLEEVKKTTEF